MYMILLIQFGLLDKQVDAVTNHLHYTVIERTPKTSPTVFQFIKLKLC